MPEAMVIRATDTRHTDIRQSTNATSIQHTATADGAIIIGTTMIGIMAGGAIGMDRMRTDSITVTVLRTPAAFMPPITGS